MAGPLSGVGGQPQIPLSQPYQPGKDVREQESRPKDTGTVAKNAYSSASNVQETREARPQPSVSSSRSSGSEDTSQKRGSVIDITI